MNSQPSSPLALGEDGPVVVVGGGQVGSLMALFLARQGHRVSVYESRPDLRRVDIDAGRSINLALAARGIAALTDLGLFGDLANILVPMAGRMVHPDVPSGAKASAPELQPYGLDPDDVIYSVSRSDLNAILLDACEATGLVTVHFDRYCREVDFEAKTATFTDYDDALEPQEVSFGTLFGCDGADSNVRRAVLAANGGTSVEDELEHGYTELTIPAAPGGGFLMEPEALHVWPRNEFMLIALANPEGNFTVTLFMPKRGAVDSFESLDRPEAVMQFFERQFPDFVPLVPDVTEQFFANPVGDLATIRTEGWTVGGDAVLVGDAAHAIVPFHGQGMNLGMESCRLLDRLIRQHPDDRSLAFSKYEIDRKPDADAIADMALDNYVEMRSSVVDPEYLIRRELALELERRFPSKVAARYGMVMFTTMRYAEVRKRAQRQNAIFATLTDGVTELSQVDWELASELVSDLSPLPTPI